MHSRARVQYNDQCISIVIILTAFVLRIYYFDYTVNARPNACTLRVAVVAWTEGEASRPGNYGIYADSGAVTRTRRLTTDERQISHQRTCLLLPSASTLRRTPWTGSCAPEPAGVIHENTTRALSDSRYNQVLPEQTAETSRIEHSSSRPNRSTSRCEESSCCGT